MATTVALTVSDKFSFPEIKLNNYKISTVECNNPHCTS